LANEPNCIDRPNKRSYVKYIMQRNINFNESNVESYRLKIKQSLVAYFSEKLTSYPHAGQLRILEIGPGSNPMFIESNTKKPSRGIQYHFIEPDIKTHDLLKRLYPDSAIFTESIETASLPIGEIDLVFAHFSLHWTNSTEVVLTKIKDSLRPGGYFVFTITDPDRSFWNQVAHEFRQKFPGSELFQTSSSKQLKISDWQNLLREAGFFIEMEFIVSGSASQESQVSNVIDNLKKAVGSRYLKLSEKNTIGTCEYWLQQRIEGERSPDRLIKIPASAHSFVCKKS
jgi:SAM-dependent methyltransferase